ncbi:NUDIX domain-containing protein [Cellulosimicrobium arenosum]|uniref:NUDIX domain-containing protein n=1 Tax=Cellulosimicrobium arenosum TaxID=2708133 RepID=UPI0019D6B735
MVAYVVHGRRLLVLTHDDVPLEIAGVQVPAGTIEHGEAPDVAVVREVLEETGLRTRVVRALGVERFDVWPSKPEVHERHFFQLASVEDVPTRWSAGEQHPSGGGASQRWTCWWTPMEHAHVLCAGLGARLGEIRPDGPVDPDDSSARDVLGADGVPPRSAHPPHGET